MSFPAPRKTAMNAAFFECRSYYGKLTRVYTRIYRYQHLASIVGWDRDAMMPAKGNEVRAAAEARVSGLAAGRCRWLVCRTAGFPFPRDHLL